MGRNRNPLLELMIREDAISWVSGKKLKLFLNSLLKNHPPNFPEIDPCPIGLEEDHSLYSKIKNPLSRQIFR